MPAALLPMEQIPIIAGQLSLEELKALRLVEGQPSGCLQNGSAIPPELATTLRILAAGGLVDPGYDGPTNGPPAMWVMNGNGERVLRHFDSGGDRGGEDAPPQEGGSWIA
jgi:hypothetical protein